MSCQNILIKAISSNQFLTKLRLNLGRFFGLIIIYASSLTWAASTSNNFPPILVYHRFGPIVSDSMTVRTSEFIKQLEFIKANSYQVVPLKWLLKSLQDAKQPLPDKSVIITVDDGHRSVYTELLPLIRQYKIPVTLFIYPSAISNASYALTWEQLHELQETGLVDIQSHTYWHPNFKIEKKRLSPDAYQAFIKVQLEKSRQVLAQHLGYTPNQIAWPFGIYDDELIAAATQAGYIAGFTLDRRSPRVEDHLLALPRYLMVDSVGLEQFKRILSPQNGARH